MIRRCPGSSRGFAVRQYNENEELNDMASRRWRQQPSLGEPKLEPRHRITPPIWLALAIACGLTYEQGCMEASASSSKVVKGTTEFVSTRLTRAECRALPFPPGANTSTVTRQGGWVDLPMVERDRVVSVSLSVCGYWPWVQETICSYPVRALRAGPVGDVGVIDGGLVLWEWSEGWCREAFSEAESIAWTSSVSGQPIDEPYLKISVAMISK